MHGALSWPPLHHKRKKKGRIKQERQQNITVSKKQMPAKLNRLPPGSGLFALAQISFPGFPLQGHVFVSRQAAESCWVPKSRFCSEQVELGLGGPTSAVEQEGVPETCGRLSRVSHRQQPLCPSSCFFPVILHSSRTFSRDNFFFFSFCEA